MNPVYVTLGKKHGSAGYEIISGPEIEGATQMAAFRKLQSEGGVNGRFEEVVLCDCLRGGLFRRARFKNNALPSHSTPPPSQPQVTPSENINPKPVRKK